ncbi:MAG: tetratricopeptide repeat protein [Candidatus Competibacterales bacterium]|nr:tetratricopeptide repeat protein [Candidatus Competibacterales bacterium]
MRQIMLLGLLLVTGAPAVGQEAVELLLDQAVRHVEAGEHERAAADLERALRIEPRDAEIWHLLGQVRLHQGHHAEAVAMAAKSDSLVQDDTGLRARNAELRATARRLAEAAGTPLPALSGSAVAAVTDAGDDLLQQPEIPVSRPLATTEPPPPPADRPGSYERYVPPPLHRHAGEGGFAPAPPAWADPTAPSTLEIEVLPGVAVSVQLPETRGREIRTDPLAAVLLDQFRHVLARGRPLERDFERRDFERRDAGRWRYEYRYRDDRGRVEWRERHDRRRDRHFKRWRQRFGRDRQFR